MRHGHWQKSTRLAHALAIRSLGASIASAVTRSRRRRRRR
jgi:hypothetical protein